MSISEEPTPIEPEAELIGPEDQRETAFPDDEYEEDKADGNGDRTFSAGEVGDASLGGAGDIAGVEAIVGEIPDEHDLSRMLWTARCSQHGLLGTVDTREEAELLRVSHLLTHRNVQI